MSGDSNKSLAAGYLFTAILASNRRPVSGQVVQSMLIGNFVKLSLKVQSTSFLFSVPKQAGGPGESSTFVAAGCCLGVVILMCLFTATLARKVLSQTTQILKNDAEQN